MQCNKLILILLFALSFLFWQTVNAEETTNSSSSSYNTPKFNLPVLNAAKRFTNNDLKSCVSLIVFWASWCGSCKQEHPVLVEIHNHTKIPMYGIDYIDTQEDASTYLANKGNPYQVVGFDENGRIGNRFGIKVVPESFLVDNKGKILYHQVGPLTKDIWENTVLPLTKSCKM